MDPHGRHVKLDLVSPGGRCPHFAIEHSVWQLHHPLQRQQARACRPRNHHHYLHLDLHKCILFCQCSTLMTPHSLTHLDGASKRIMPLPLQRRLYGRS